MKTYKHLQFNLGMNNMLKIIPFLNQKSCMKSLFVQILCVILFCLSCLIMCVSSCLAVTYFIRPDGGTDDQCTGLADAPYPGSGSNQPCAWSHPFWALDGSGNWKIQGGDTLIIHLGSYRMGIGAPNTNWCNANWSWDCHLPPLPSGPDTTHPTRILGFDWDQGCTDAPELWGAKDPGRLSALITHQMP